MAVRLGRFKLLKVTPNAIRVAPVDKEACENVKAPSEWIPQSQVASESEVWKESQEGQEGQIWVTDWLAEKRGWV